MADKPQREVIYDEEQFKKLSSSTNEQLLNIFYELLRKSRRIYQKTHNE